MADCVRKDCNEAVRYPVPVPLDDEPLDAFRTEVDDGGRMDEVEDE